MKELFKFSVKKEDGVVEFSFIEPTKAITKEGDLVYKREYAIALRNGLLTNAEALKLSNERGGVFTEDEKTQYIDALTLYVNKEKELEDKKKAGEDTTLLAQEVSSIREKVLVFQSKNDAIYSNTVESMARDASILHYALALTYNNGKPHFKGNDYNARLQALDENDVFTSEILKKAVWYANALYFGIKDLNEAKYPEDVPAATSTAPDTAKA